MGPPAFNMGSKGRQNTFDIWPFGVENAWKKTRATFSVQPLGNSRLQADDIAVRHAESHRSNAGAKKCACLWDMAHYTQ